MHYYQFNIGDYRRDTTHLSLLEHGIYRQLIDQYYLNEKPISDDLNKTSRLLNARTEVEKAAVKNVLNDFFILEIDGWHHKKADELIAEYHAYIEKQRTNGGKGGRPVKNPPVSQNNPPVSQTKPKITLTTNHKPLTTNQEPITNNLLKTFVEQTRPGDLEIENIFEFWKIELNHPKATLDAKRKKAIQARLKEGYTAERIKEAIIGIQSCSHNMGHNDRNTVYDDIELICRTGANVDRFADLKTSNPNDKIRDKFSNLLIGDYRDE
jgi:uncharacterized protein YdaU (DUF1376 family)